MSIEEMYALSEMIANIALRLHPTPRNDAPPVYTSSQSSSVRASFPSRFLESLATSPPKEALSLFDLQEQFDGCVIEMNETSFVARLVSRTGASFDQDVEFKKSEVREDQRHLVNPGAYFRWDVGHWKLGAWRGRLGILEFNQSNVWSSKELKDAKAQADRFC